MAEEETTSQQPIEGSDQPIDEGMLSEGAEEATEEAGQAEAGKKPKQSREANRAFAEARRAREAAAKAQKTPTEQEAYETGWRDAQKAEHRTNPYTGDPIENDHDLSIYLDMRKLDEQGKDPLKAFPRELARRMAEADAKEAEERKAREEKEAQEAKVKADIERQTKELMDAHPGIDLQSLMSDDEFKAYASPKFGRWTYLEIVEGYQARQAKAQSPKPKATPSTTPGGSRVQKSIEDMTDAEFVAHMRSKYGTF